MTSIKVKEKNLKLHNMTEAERKAAIEAEEKRNSPSGLLGKYFVFIADNSKEDPKYKKENERLIWKRLIRMSRETVSQIIADGDRIGMYGEKYKQPDGDHLYKQHDRIAKRFKKKPNGELLFMCDRSWNRDRSFAILPLSIENIKCSKSFAELFQISMFSENFRMSENMKSHIEFSKERSVERGKEYVPHLVTFEERSEARSYCVLKHIEEEEKKKPFGGFSEWDMPIVRHLEEVFNLPVYELHGAYMRPDFYAGTDTLGAEAISYQITHFGEDKRMITFDENYFNREVYLWVFDDRVIFCHKS